VVSQFTVRLPGEGPKDAREASDREIMALDALERAWGVETPCLQAMADAGLFEGAGRLKKRLAAMNGAGAAVGEKHGSEGRAVLYAGLLSRTVDKFFLRAALLLREALRRRAALAGIARRLAPADREGKPFSPEERERRAAAALEIWFRDGRRPGWDNCFLAGKWEESFPGAGGPPADPAGGKAFFAGLAETLTARPGAAEGILKALEGRLRAMDEVLGRSIREVRLLLHGDFPGRPCPVRGRRMLGGLGWNRIKAHSVLCSVMRSFRGRDGAGNAAGPSPEEAGLLAAVGRMKTERRRLLAGRLAGAALGLSPRTKGPERPGPAAALRRLPCAGIVVEDLASLAQSGARTRRGNSVVRDLSPMSQLRELSQAAQISGLLLYKADPAYTSVTDSRTGAWGIRAEALPLHKLTSFWRLKRLRAAAERLAAGKGRPGDACLAGLWEIVKGRKAGELKGLVITAVLPAPGGPLFMSGDGGSPAAKGLGADVNAAVSIALRAFTPPDAYAAWRGIPADPATGEVKAKGVLVRSMREAGLPLAEGPDGKACLPEGTFSLSGDGRGAVLMFFVPNGPGPGGSAEAGPRYLTARECREDAAAKVCARLITALKAALAANGIRGSPDP
jgi:hypothetical protein